MPRKTTKTSPAKKVAEGRRKPSLVVKEGGNGATSAEPVEQPRQAQELTDPAQVHAAQNHHLRQIVTAKNNEIANLIQQLAQLKSANVQLENTVMAMQDNALNAQAGLPSSYDVVEKGGKTFVVPLQTS